MQHAWYNSFGTSVTYFRIGNSSVVAMWYVPRPRVQALILLRQDWRMSQADQASEGLVAK